MKSKDGLHREAQVQLRFVAKYMKQWLKPNLREIEHVGFMPYANKEGWQVRCDLCKGTLDVKSIEEIEEHRTNCAFNRLMEALTMLEHQLSREDI